MPIARQTDAAGENNSHHSTKYRLEEALAISLTTALMLMRN